MLPHTLLVLLEGPGNDSYFLRNLAFNVSRFVCVKGKFKTDAPPGLDVSHSIKQSDLDDKHERLLFYLSREQQSKHKGHSAGT